MPEQQARPEAERPKPVNILDPGLEKGIETELNPDADAWGPLEPPPAGAFPLRVLEGAVDPWTQGKRRDSSHAVYYSVNLECRIADGDFRDVPVFSRASTVVARGREISTMAGLIRKAGFKIPAKGDDLKIARLFKELLKKEPVIWADCDWEVWSRAEQRVIKRGMLNMPEDPEGGYEYVVQDREGNPCPARLRVTHWYGKGEEHPALGQVAAGKGEPELETLTMTTEAAAQGKPKAAAKAPAPKPKEDEDSLVVEE